VHLTEFSTALTLHLGQALMDLADGFQLLEANPSASELVVK
jgi:hypothetical protein